MEIVEHTHTHMHVLYTTCTHTPDANKGLFSGKVYGPIQIELEVESDEVGRYLEAAVTSYLDYFVVERREDFRRYILAHTYCHSHDNGVSVSGFATVFQ